MNETIAIVDRGRGPQLSTNRITVLDLVRYFQKGCGYDEIMRWMPSLSREEIAVAERFYLHHREEMDERDRQATARREEAVRQQRRTFPAQDGSRDERITRLRQLVAKRREEKNGEGRPG